MHIKDLESLVDERESDLIKIVELTSGVKLTTPYPLSLKDELEGLLEDSISNGVSYSDVNVLKSMTGLESLTVELDPNSYPFERGYVGLTKYQSVLRDAISQLGEINKGQKA